MFPVRPEAHHQVDFCRLIPFQSGEQVNPNMDALSGPAKGRVSAGLNLGFECFGSLGSTEGHLHPPGHLGVDVRPLHHCGRPLRLQQLLQAEEAETGGPSAQVVLKAPKCHLHCTRHLMKAPTGILNYDATTCMGGCFV